MTTSTAARPWTAAAFLTQLAYLLWLPAMFAFGYLLGSWLGYEPGMNEDVGFRALAVNVIVAVAIIPLPSWIGAALAAQGLRERRSTPAVAALALCLIIGLALMVMSLPLSGV